MPTITQAVAQREQHDNGQPAEVTPARAIQQIINRYRPVILKLLKGTGIDEETFVAQIANACRATPKLWDCTPSSMLGAALRCAQLGLAPNDVRNLAWIIPYADRKTGVIEATFQLGYGGVMELARRAEPGLRFDGRAVYPNDDFDVDYGRIRPLTHRPAVVRKMDRGGDAFCWYVRATYPDGAEHIEVLDRQGAEYHRGFSKQPDGLMWTRSYDAAALKSTILQMRRFLPSSAQLVGAIASDERVIDVDDVLDDETSGGGVDSLPPSPDTGEADAAPPAAEASPDQTGRAAKPAKSSAGAGDATAPADQPTLEEQT